MTKMRGFKTQKVTEDSKEEKNIKRRAYATMTNQYAKQQDRTWMERPPYYLREKYEAWKKEQKEKSTI